MNLKPPYFTGYPKNSLKNSSVEKCPKKYLILLLTGVDAAPLKIKTGAGAPVLR